MRSFVLDRTSGKPPYKQLRDHVFDMVAKGDLQANERLPSVRRMVSMYSVSNTTVQKAMHDLKSRGIVMGRPGDGLFVAQPPSQAEAGAPELWVESMEWLGEERIPFLNKFGSLHPAVSVREHAADNDLRSITLDFLPQQTASLDDVTDLVLETYGRDEDDAILDCLRGPDGRLHCFPLFINVQVVAENLDLFERMGVELPPPDWTWDDFLRIGRALTDPAKGSFGFAPTRHWDLMLPLVWQVEGRVFSEDGDRCLLDEDAALQAGRFMRAWQEICVPREALRSRRALDVFREGSVGMARNGAWGYTELDRREGLRWEARPLPMANRASTWMTAHGYGLSRRSRHREAATAFMRESGRHELWPRDLRFPCAIPLHLKLERNGQVERTYRAALRHGRSPLSDIAPERRSPVQEAALKAINRYIRPLVYDDEPVERLMRQVCSEISALLAAPGEDMAQ